MSGCGCIIGLDHGMGVTVVDLLSAMRHCYPAGIVHCNMGLHYVHCNGFIAKDRM